MFSVSSVQSTQPVITEPLGPVFIVLRARTGEFKLNLRCWAELKLYELRGKNYFKCIIGPAHTIAIFFTNCLTNCGCATGATRERWGDNTEKTK